MPTTLTGRSPISSSAITAPRGSSIGRSSAATSITLDMLLHQQGIAVPAEVAGVDLEQPLGMLAAGQAFQRAPVADPEGHRLVQAMLVDQLVRHRRPAPADALVGLLQRDDVGVDFLEDVQHPVGPPPPVGPDRLAHIIAGDGDGRGGGHRSANLRRVTRFLKRPGWRRRAHSPG